MSYDESELYCVHHHDVWLREGDPSDLCCHWGQVSQLRRTTRAAAGRARHHIQLFIQLIDSGDKTQYTQRGYVKLTCCIYGSILSTMVSTNLLVLHWMTKKAKPYELETTHTVIRTIRASCESFRGPRLPVPRNHFQVPLKITAILSFTSIPAY